MAVRNKKNYIVQNRYSTLHFEKEFKVRGSTLKYILDKYWHPYKLHIEEHISTITTIAGLIISVCFIEQLDIIWKFVIIFIALALGAYIIYLAIKDYKDWKHNKDITCDDQYGDIWSHRLR